MSLQLPVVPAAYTPDNERQRNRMLEQADRGNHKRGRDMELGPGEAIILRAPNGTRYRVKVENNGDLATELV